MEKRLSLLLMSLFLVGSTSSGFSQESAGEWENVFDSFESIVVTASQTAEPIKEAPVPVTVITRQMIDRMGAKTLKDVLVTVPGFDFVQDHNEVNVASRGIYASSQQKFMVARDGHRLNTRSYQEANPDHHISLQGVERIEILRGPGGSLYGDVALTGVVNLISKKGSEVQGGKISVGGGNFGQNQVNFEAGQSIGENSELMVYGHYFKSDGEEIEVDASEDYSLPANAQSGDVYVGRYDDEPSFDVGANLSVRDFKAHVSKSRSSYTEPRTGGGTTGAIYNMDSYNEYNGYGRGLTTDTLHLYGQQSFQIGENFNWTVKAYYDESEITANLVSNPTAGVGLGVRWDDMDYGLVTYGSLDYSAGSVLFGVQYENMEVESSDPVIVQTSAGDRPLSSNIVLQTGEEESYALFGQLKHRFNETLLFNTGVRYDALKRAYGDEDPDEVSPRVALIYNPNENMFFKASFTRSFEEAPYWYRYNNLASYQGASDLNPETMDSIQLTASFRQGEKITHHINLFNNDLTDLVYRDTATNRYNNAGSVETRGLEYEMRYNLERASVRLNYTYMDLVDATVYPSTDDEINNIPTHKANLIFDFQPFSALDTLWMHLYVRYIGDRKSPEGSNSSFTRYDPYNEEDAVTLVNFKTSWDIGKGFDLGILVENVFDEEWSQGGSTAIPYEQAGRWYFIEFGYKWEAA